MSANKKKALLMQMDTSGWWLRTWLGGHAGTTKLLKVYEWQEQHGNGSKQPSTYTWRKVYITNPRHHRTQVGPWVLADGEDELVSLVGS